MSVGEDNDMSGKFNPPVPPPRRQHLRGNFSGALFTRKVPLETGAPQLFDASYAPVLNFTLKFRIQVNYNAMYCNVQHSPLSSMIINVRSCPMVFDILSDQVFGITFNSETKMHLPHEKTCHVFVSKH